MSFLRGVIPTSGVYNSMSLMADQQWCPTSVQVTVHQARGLRVKGKSGTNDAYAVMQVGKDKFQTSVAEKSVAPVWKEEAAFDLPPLLHQGGTERGTLHVHVLHRALVGPDKPLGQAVINLLLLSEDKTRNKTEWFKLLDKAGKADKDRGEVLVDIQFMRNNMTASMFDLSAAGKSRSRLGKFKDKVRGKKKESDTMSNVVPSFTQVLTDSEEEDGDGQMAAGKDGKKKKNKIKSLFSPKSNLQKNMSQSMSVLPGKNSSLSGSQSSGLNMDFSEGKKKFKFKIHKRTGSSDSKDSSSSLQKPGNLCINGSHVYREEPPPRTARTGSNFSLASSGHGSMEDVPESSPPSVESLRGVRQYSPWTEEEEDAEVENTKEEAADLRREQEERFKEEEERRREEEEEELEMLAKEKRRQEAERRNKEERDKKEEEERRKEEEKRAWEEDEEERERLAEVKRRLEEERKIEDEKFRKEEIERRRKEEEDERRREEEERARKEEEEEEERERLAEGKRRLEEQERMRIEEEENWQRKEDERMRMEEEEERAQKERMRRREEEEKEEYEKLVEEKIIREEQERRRIEEEEIIKNEEQEMIRAEEQRRAEEEKVRMERIRKEEEDRAEEERRTREEEETVKRREEELEEQMRLEEKRRRDEEERIQKEEKEKARREKEEYERLVEEKRKLEEEEEKEEEKKRIEAEEEVRREERIRVEEEERVRREEEREKMVEDKRKREAQERLEEEERMMMEETRREEEEKARKEKEEYERLVEEKIRQEELERRRIKEEERISKEIQEMIRVEEERRRRVKEEEERARKEKEKMERLAEEKAEKERKEEERLERERMHEEEQKKENKTNHKAAEIKSAERQNGITVSNPFEEENFSNNPFEEDPDSKVSTDQQGCPSSVSLVGSMTACADEKDLISTQREKRPAPQPPGRNQAERQSQEELEGYTLHGTQLNQQSTDKDANTAASVLPLRSVQSNAPLSRSPVDAKNTSSLAQIISARETTNVSKHSKRPAPSRPGTVEDGGQPDPKTEYGPEVKQEPIVYGLNPFEVDDDEIVVTTTSGNTGSIQWPPAVSDKENSSQTKIKSSKVSRAPLVPAKKEATSSTLIHQNTDEVGLVTDNTGARDTESGTLRPVHAQETPLQVSQHATVQSARGEARRKEDGPPTTSRRLLPVKPLNLSNQQSVSITSGENDKSTGILSEVQDKTKVNERQLKGPYSLLTQQELISLVLKQEKQISEKDKKISELEKYIDDLLVRVIEESPSILMSLSALKNAV